MIFKVTPDHTHELRQVAAAECAGKWLGHSDLYVDGERLGVIIRIDDIEGERFIHYDSRPIKE
jgi:hypothetical protein